MSYLRHRDAPHVWWHRELARWLIADLARLAPTEEIEHHLDRLRMLEAEYDAEVQRRHDLTARVAQAFEYAHGEVI